MMMRRLLPLLLPALLLTGVVSSGAAAQPTTHVCDAAAAKAERDWSVPPGVLSAVGTVESGRAGPLGAAPWPWTINAAGVGRYFDSKEEAIAAVLALMTRGYPYIDIGCFQIDIAYHPGVFRSLDDAFDPELNAQAAARILSAERARTPDWSTAVARYHSATPSLGGPYLNRVRAALPSAKLRAVTAEFLVDALQALPPIATVGLPAVIYAIPPAPNGRAPQIIRLPVAPRASMP